MRSPYGKMDEKWSDGKRYTAAGYVIVVQDCRGRGKSEGPWDPFRYDVEDGFEEEQLEETPASPPPAATGRVVSETVNAKKYGAEYRIEVFLLRVGQLELLPDRRGKDLDAIQKDVDAKLASGAAKQA